MSDNDSEVERIMAERPPSSYGSMRSDDSEDDDEIQDVGPQPIITVNLRTRVQVNRPDSPETGVTSITQDRRTSVHNEGVFVTVPRKEQDPGDVIMEVEDNASSVFMRESQARQRNNVQAEASVLEPTHLLTPVENSVDEFSLRYVFTAMLDILRNLNAMELQYFVGSLCSQSKGQLQFRQLEQEGELDVLGVVDQILEKWGKGEALHITIHALNDINKHAIASTLGSVCRRVLVQFDLRASHKRRYYSLYEGTCRPGQQRYIRHVYVESPIVFKTPTNEEKLISPTKLFSPLEGEGDIRVVMTSGIPAIGLTVTTQMFIIDWTEERVCQDIQFVFALPGRDLHLVRNSEQTFLEFLASFYPEAKHAEFLSCQDCTVLFVIDALELCRQPLEFQNHPGVTEMTARAPVGVLLTSLIKGDLLPHARVWITAHRSTSLKLPANCISRFTELKGFGNTQKDEYFTKRTKDPTHGRRILELVKSSPGLYDACYLPLFSWIVSFVYERHLQIQGFAEPAQTLTTFYTQYVIVLTNRKIERYVGTGLEESRWKEADKEFLMKMGRLALNMLLDGTSVFCDRTVRNLTLDIHDVTHRGGISSETGEPTRENGRSFRFIHHSVQDFMAAMYVYVTFRMTGENALEPRKSKTKTARPVSELYKPVIDRVLARRDGHMDLFLRFLLGLSAHGTEMHLRGHLLPQYHPEPKGVADVLKYARKKIKENAVAERCRNLELCLSELEEGKNIR
ncbi:protein NLRC3 [Neoarius graeffei]|uniref:protein NLRC3 n=1 Tax=Neoarius graeffei TaxID=443677 RepID=UPI00298BCD3D|nr:protein NLRC3 [Neoarius graeffei]